MTTWTTLIYPAQLNAGGTSLLHRFSFDSFTVMTPLTIGAEFKSITFENNDKFHLWNVSSRKIFQSIGWSYAKMADIVLVAIDLSSSETYNSNIILPPDLSQLREHAPPTAEFYFVGTKQDRSKAGEESLIKLQEMAQTMGFSPNRCFVTSAKTGVGIQACLEKLHSNMLLKQEGLAASKAGGQLTQVRETFFESGNPRASHIELTARYK